MFKKAWLVDALCHKQVVTSLKVSSPDFEADESSDGVP